jgi:putative DNA primase/helicase
MVTMRSPIHFDPDARAPRWLQFLDEVFPSNTELIHWLHKYTGYCLTGDTREQVILIGYGSGANGKTVLLSALREVIGDYAYDAPISTFELANRSPIPNDLAALDGKRFVTSSETNQGTRFNEARIKALTGQDSITARFLHHEYFTFKPVAKFFLAVNHRPRVYDDSYGFWRRVRLIPFTQEFRYGADDKELLAKLIAEAPGILAWMVAGCLLWQKEGLEPTPGCILIATKEYESESDPLADFISDECVITPRASVLSSKIYKKYKARCAGQGMTDREILTSNAFGRRMSPKFKKSQKEDRTHYVGLAMNGRPKKEGNNVSRATFYRRLKEQRQKEEGVVQNGSAITVPS